MVMILHKPMWHAHPHVRSGDELSLGERAADRVKRGLGSWTFIFLQTGIVIVWIIGNMTTLHGLGLPHWDPYPFILLNLAFSTQAAYAAPILQLSNNRSDRQASELALSTHSIGQKQLALSEQQQKDSAVLRELVEANLALSKQNTAMLTELQALRASVDDLAEANPVDSAPSAPDRHDTSTA